MINDKVLKNEEKAIFALRALYKQYGYLPFKMSKFEEYDLYVENKSFLTGANVITFNDTDGRLLALKPDVTLSIIKNTKDERGCKQKVYYNESVYRVSQRTARYKEIMQAGLECVGDIDLLDIFEVLYLAARSLSLISSSFALDISHMGILSSLLDWANGSPTFKKEFIRLLSEKNMHEAEKLLSLYEVDEQKRAPLLSLIGMCGPMHTVLSLLEPLCRGIADEEYAELSSLCELLSERDIADKINIDFSVVNDMKYYNGIVFKGFIFGICDSVLSGGEYATLMHRMEREASGIGFAIYLDLLDGLSEQNREYDVDVVLVYNERCDVKAVLSKKKDLIESGSSVLCVRAVPENVRAKEIIYMD